MNPREQGFGFRGSIPPRTALGVLRTRELAGRRSSIGHLPGGRTVAAQIGRGHVVGGGVRRVFQRPTAGENWNKHVINNPSARGKASPEPLRLSEESGKFEVEIVDNYDAHGGLGVIPQISGIQFTGAFSRVAGREDEPANSAGFTIEIDYKGSQADLRLTTTVDILDIQILPKTGNPMLQEEVYLSQLGEGGTHDPDSMRVTVNNGLAVVDYQLHT